MYEWRKLTEEQRMKVLASRQKNLRPWHSPPHFDAKGPTYFHLCASCYEHHPIVGTSDIRMAELESQLINLFSQLDRKLYAWCVLPNHWHALVRVGDLKMLLNEVGQLHGRTSFLWNREDKTRGRKCWHGCADRRIRSDRHFYVARNYIHHNPVKHGYVEKWEDWPYSSAGDFIAEAGRDAVLREWQQYPVMDMGRGWDD